MKLKKYCVRCGANDWKQIWSGWGAEYKCKKCGYVYNGIHYITAGKVQANTITASKLKTNLFNPFPKKNNTK